MSWGRFSVGSWPRPEHDFPAVRGHTPGPPIISDLGSLVERGVGHSPELVDWPT